MRFLLRLGVRKGLLGGSRPWTHVFVLAGIVGLLRRLMAKPEPELVWRGKVTPGQTLVVETLPPSTGRRS